MLLNIVSQNDRCLIATDARSESLEEIRAAVAEAVTDSVQNATGVIVVFKVNGRTPADGLLLTAATNYAQVEVWCEAIAKEAFLLLG